VKRLITWHPAVSAVGYGESRLFEAVADVWPFLRRDAAYSVPAAARAYRVFRAEVRERLGDTQGVGAALDALSERLGAVPIRLPGQQRGWLPPPLAEDVLVPSFGSFVREVLTSAALVPGRSVVCEKTPSNAQYLAHIGRLVPDARAVVLLRNPIHVALSHTTRDWGPSDPLAAATYTAAYFRRWREVAGCWGNWLLVRHEDLVTDPAGQFSRILDHLNLPRDRELLRRVSAEVRPSIDRTSTLGPMTLAGIVERLESELEAFGYPSPTKPAVRSSAPLVKPALPPVDAVANQLRRIWSSGFVTNGGPVEQEFEAALSREFGWPAVAVTANGTLALQLLFRAFYLRGEVVIPAFGFPALAQALAACGLVPVLADIETPYLTLDPAAVERAITPATSAVVAVHTFGYPANVEVLEQVARRYGLPLLFDAAPAVGVRYNGRPLTDFGDGVAFSFHATKVFTTIEGGAACVRDPMIDATIRRLRNFGLPPGADGVPMNGTNAKLNEVLAAIGLHNLAEFANNVERRATAAERYRYRLDGIPGVEVIRPRLGTASNHSYLATRLRDSDGSPAADIVRDRLAAQMIDSRRYFGPGYQVRGIERRAGTPVADAAALDVLCLPLWPGIPEDTINQVCEVITAVVA